MAWTPIRYVNRAYSRTVLAGLYRAARAALVTPLRDGMNLVAKEYVAAQDPERPGRTDPVALRRGGGRAQARRCWSILTIPRRWERTIAHALSMPLEERRQRHDALFQVISENDIKSWGELSWPALTQEAELPTWREQLGLQPPMNPGLLKLPQ